MSVLQPSGPAFGPASTAEEEVAAVHWLQDQPWGAHPAQEGPGCPSATGLRFPWSGDQRQACPRADGDIRPPTMPLAVRVFAGASLLISLIVCIDPGPLQLPL